MKKFVLLLLSLSILFSLSAGAVLPFAVNAEMPRTVRMIDLDRFRFLQYFREYFEFQGTDFETKEEMYERLAETTYGGYGWTKSDRDLCYLFEQVPDFESFPMLYLSPQSGYRLTDTVFDLTNKPRIRYTYVNNNDQDTVEISVFLTGRPQTLSPSDFYIEEYAAFCGYDQYLSEREQHLLKAQVPAKFGDLSVCGQSVSVYRYDNGYSYAYIESDSWEGVHMVVEFGKHEAMADLYDLSELLQLTTLAQLEAGEVTAFYSLPPLAVPRTDVWIDEVSTLQAEKQRQDTETALWIGVLSVVIVGAIVTVWLVRRQNRKQSASDASTK